MTRKINKEAKADENTGFGAYSSMYGGRLLRQNGKPNVKRRGVGIFERLSLYHTLIDLPRYQFVLLLFVAFLFANLLFAIIYLIVGAEHLTGMETNTNLQKFIEAYFFSAQTFTTVGYGRISPTGYLTSMIAAIEAFTGLLFFALATGLFYGRFSRPRAHLKFSENALIAPFRDGIAFMFRIAPYKNNYLTNAEVKLTLGTVVEENGSKINKFYDLPLQIPRINALNLSWTIVHPIDKHSPIYGLSVDDLRDYHAEVLVFVSAFDEAFSNTVIARTSYMMKETLWGRKFSPMYHRSHNGEHTIIEIDKINDHESAEMKDNKKTSPTETVIPRI